MSSKEEPQRMRAETTWRGRSGYQIFVAATVLLASLSKAVPQQRTTAGAKNIAEIYQKFITPPDDARPMVRWWWFGTAVEKPEILHELEQMKADGIGGAELAFVYPEALDDAARGVKNLPFLSTEMLDDVNYAQAEGRKLGLRIDVTLCSGWPYGGPATTLAEAAGHLHTVQVQLRPGETAVPTPPLADGDSLIAAAIVNGEQNHWNPATAHSLTLMPSGIVVTPANAPRTVLFFIASHTRQKVKRAAVGAEGYVLDPFSHDAVATHLKFVGEPLVNAFGSTPPYAIFSDSLEAYGADWTPDLPAEFLKRRGYDLIPHLAELVAGGSVAADTVRHDYGRTLTELVDQNYVTQINDWAIAHHTRFRSQTYGEPAVSFSSQNMVGLAEGEGPQWRAFSTLRWATSANHVFGHNITSGETFTWLHSPVFRATPLDMKAEADIDLIMGENQFIFHGWPYSAPQVSEPGWSLYAAAALNDHNPWHPVMPSVTAYIARLSYLMRQGEPANQVAVLLPTDDAWASFSPGKVSVTAAMTKLVPPALTAAILSAGYNFDFIDADAINRLGIHHQILVLPATDRIPAETLEKIATYVAEGGRVIAVGRVPSMSAEGKPQKILPVCNRGLDPQRSTVCHPLFDPAKLTLIADVSHLAEALHEAAEPDFQLASTDDATRNQIGFIRRKLSSADIYLVVNTSNRPVDTIATFATTHKFAEQWNPDNATLTLASVSSQPIHLAPYESRVFVFADSQLASKPAPALASARELADLSRDWRVTFTSTGKSVTEASLTDWIADPSTLHYSGEVVYERDFTIGAAQAPSTVFLEVDGGKPLPGPPNSSPEPALLSPDGLANPLVTRPGPGMHAYYEPPVREAALLTINGQPAGALWHPPYVLDVSKFLKPGQNHIEIHVYNTALNAWSSLPPHDYGPLIAKYGDRFQMQDLDKVRPISSGLLGSIHLVIMEQK
jgi:hypothetical protein